MSNCLIGTANESSHSTRLGLDVHLPAGHLDGPAGAEQLVETIELPNHRWFFACQFHPEFTSTPRDGHPLFKSFVEAAIAYAKDNGREGLSC